MEKREDFQHDILAHQWPVQMINNNNTAVLVGRNSSALAYKCQELSGWEYTVWVQNRVVALLLQGVKEAKGLSEQTPASLKPKSFFNNSSKTSLFIADIFYKG